MNVVRLRYAASMIAGCLSVTALGGTAQAAGFAAARFGSEHGHAATSNATAIYFNPAGIGEARGTRLFLDGTIAFRSARYERPAPSGGAPEAELGNYGDAKLRNVIAAPMVGITDTFGDFVLGAAYFVPFGGSTSWNENDDVDRVPPGPRDGVQRWHNIEGEIRSQYLSAALAYRVGTTGLSLGVSGNLIRSNIDTVRARTVTGTDSIADEGRSQVDAGGWHGSFGVGAMYQAVPRVLWLGLSYQASPKVSGAQRLSGTLRNYFGGSITETKIDLHQDLPEVYRAAVRYRPQRDLELRLVGDLTLWSSLESHCITVRGAECRINANGTQPEGTADVIQNIKRDWNDTFAVRFGGSHWLDDTELFASVGYDSNAVPDETLEPTFIDSHKLTGTIGARFALAEDVHLAASYLHVYYFSRDTTGESVHPELEAPSRSPDSGGEYDLWLGALNVNLEVGFGGD